MPNCPKSMFVALIISKKDFFAKFNEYVNNGHIAFSSSFFQIFCDFIVTYLSKFANDIKNNFQNKIFLLLHHVFDETEGKEEILLLNTWAFTYVRHVDFFPMHCQFAYVKDLRIWKCFMLHSILNITYILFSKDLYVKSSLNKMSPQGLNGIFVIKIWIQIQVYVVSMRTNSLQISL